MNEKEDTVIYLSPAIIGYILSVKKKDREEEYNEIVSNVKYYGKNVKKNDTCVFWTKKHPVEVWHDGINFYEENVYDTYFLNEKYNSVYAVGWYKDSYKDFAKYLQKEKLEEFCKEAYEEYKNNESFPEL